MFTSLFSSHLITFEKEKEKKKKKMQQSDHYKSTTLHNKIIYLNLEDNQCATKL